MISPVRLWVHACTVSCTVKPMRTLQVIGVNEFRYQPIRGADPLADPLGTFEADHDRLDCREKVDRRNPTLLVNCKLNKLLVATIESTRFIRPSSNKLRQRIMAITINAILQFCSITVADQRNRIEQEILSDPEVLMHLNDESTEDMITTFRDYGRREMTDGKIIFSRVQQKRLISLKDWVKDRARLKENDEFEDRTDRATFITTIEEATERRKCRITQKKIGESLITATFQVQLETASQWDRWRIELESILKMII